MARPMTCQMPLQDLSDRVVSMPGMEGIGLRKLPDDWHARLVVQGKSNATAVALVVGIAQVLGVIAHTPMLPLGKDGTLLNSMPFLLIHFFLSV